MGAALPRSPPIALRVVDMACGQCGPKVGAEPRCIALNASAVGNP
jgi:hypothetical protein